MKLTDEQYGILYDVYNSHDYPYSSTSAIEELLIMGLVTLTEYDTLDITRAGCYILNRQEIGGVYGTGDYSITVYEYEGRVMMTSRDSYQKQFISIDITNDVDDLARLFNRLRDRHVEFDTQNS